MSDHELSQKKHLENQGMLEKFLTEDLKTTHGTTLSVLDALRRSRKSRGGVGAPLEVPGHLRPNTEIVITDKDLKDS